MNVAAADSGDNLFDNKTQGGKILDLIVQDILKKVELRKQKILKNKEEAKDQFAKIVNAYETLKDKEKRKIYDKHGEEGVRRHAQG